MHRISKNIYPQITQICADFFYSGKSREVIALGRDEKIHTIPPPRTCYGVAEPYSFMHFVVPFNGNPILGPYFKDLIYSIKTFASASLTPRSGMTL